MTLLFLFGAVVGQTLKKLRVPHIHKQAAFMIRILEAHLNGTKVPVIAKAQDKVCS